jgi:hypothetical protein
MSAPATGRQLVAAFGAPVVWAAHFGTLYAVNATACARTSAPSILATTTIATLLAIAVIVTFWRIGEGAPAGLAGDDRSTHTMLRFLSRWLGGLSLLAILWTAVPVFLVEACR